MATTRRRFFNPNNVKHATVGISTVQQISLNRTWQRLTAQGDADLTDSFQAKVNLQVSGTIVIQDSVQADALLDSASGSLAWDGTPEAGGVAKTITVTGVEFFNLAETDSHNAVDNITLGWNAYSPTGADPVTTTLAS